MVQKINLIFSDNIVVQHFKSNLFYNHLLLIRN